MRLTKQTKNKVQGSAVNQGRDCRLSLETLEPRMLLSVQYSLADVGTLVGDDSLAWSIDNSGQIDELDLVSPGTPPAYVYDDSNLSVTEPPPATTTYSADYLVAPNTPWLLIEAEWENANDNVTVEVTDPDGIVYAEADFGSYSHIMIVDTLTDSYRKTVFVNEPDPGTWSVEFFSSVDLVNIAISGVVQDGLPTIEITGVDPDFLSQEVTVEYAAVWTDTNTEINFYYDTDAENTDGVLWAGDIAPTATGTAVWDIS
ncbi:MAG: hypothetical protein JW810_11940, partial [Sedimentisphaerales bacterium]|nr:hypothetical protein [Sedimentisphaerales bacterium]